MDVNLTSENNPHGYILEVDLEYPDQLHELHNDYPLAPEELEISNDILSKLLWHCKKYGIKFGGVNKLVSNLGN